jgi:hypothetical protein
MQIGTKSGMDKRREEEKVPTWIELFILIFHSFKGEFASSLQFYSRLSLLVNSPTLLIHPSKSNSNSPNAPNWSIPFIHSPLSFLALTIKILHLCRGVQQCFVLCSCSVGWLADSSSLLVVPLHSPQITAVNGRKISWNEWNNSTTCPVSSSRSHEEDENIKEFLFAPLDRFFSPSIPMLFHLVKNKKKFGMRWIREE